MKIVHLPQLTWGWYDALVFCGISANGTDLRSLLACIDMVNHSIPTLRELNISLRRLRGSGLVNSNKNEWRLTPDATERIERFAFRARGGMFEQVDRWLRFLNTVPLTPDKGPNIRTATYRKGLEAYHQWVEELKPPTKLRRSAH